MGEKRFCSGAGTGRSATDVICASCAGLCCAVSAWRSFTFSPSVSSLTLVTRRVSLQDLGRVAPALILRPADWRLSAAEAVLDLGREIYFVSNHLGFLDE